jgi:hypothetical protein
MAPRDSPFAAPARRRPWPPPAVVALALGAVVLAIALVRFQRGRSVEPLPAAERWSVDPEAARALEAFLAAAPPAPPGFMRGIALGLHSKDVEYDYGHLIDEIADHRAGWISLFFNMYQQNAESVEIAPATRSIDQERMLRRATAQARARGLKVMLFPIVLLSEAGERDWRGNLRPRRLDRWFANYGAHVERLARLAEEIEIDALCVGSEFSSLEGEADRWRALIARVRERFGGKVLYSANWDHFDLVPFWDAVDYIGLSGYYELTDTNEPTPAALVAAWSAARDDILDWRRRAGLAAPILFTEIGYANQDGTNVRPWDYTADAPPDPAEQAMGHEAFIRAWHGREELAGVFFYNWFGFDSPEDTGYSPRGKPAAQLIRVWFGR